MLMPSEVYIVVPTILSFIMAKYLYDSIKLFHFDSLYSVLLAAVSVGGCFFFSILSFSFILIALVAHL